MSDVLLMLKEKRIVFRYFRSRFIGASGGGLWLDGVGCGLPASLACRLDLDLSYDKIYII